MAICSTETHHGKTDIHHEVKHLNRNQATTLCTVITHPAAKTLPSVEKAQQRPLVSEAMAWGDFSSMLQNRTNLTKGHSRLWLELE